MDEISIKKPLFGKEVEFVVWDAEESITREVIEGVYHEGLRLEKIFNFYDKESELSLLNKRRRCRVSEELRIVVTKALEFSKDTNGKYDVTKGMMFLAQKNKGKTKEASCSWKEVKIEGKEITLMHKDVLIDLGSIAKGFIVDRLIEKIKEEGILSALVDGRGDMKSFGLHSDKIGIQNPRNKESLIGNIYLKDCAVATSGDYNQFHKDYDNSHIFNKTEAISATVVADECMLADAMATVMLVVEKEERDKLAKKYKVKALVIDNKMKNECYNSFQNLWVS